MIRASRIRDLQRTVFLWKDDGRVEQQAAPGLLSIFNRGSWSCAGFGTAVRVTHVRRGSDSPSSWSCTPSQLTGRRPGRLERGGRRTGYVQVAGISLRLFGAQSTTDGL